MLSAPLPTAHATILDLPPTTRAASASPSIAMAQATLIPTVGTSPLMAQPSWLPISRGPIVDPVLTVVAVKKA